METAVLSQLRGGRCGRKPVLMGDGTVEASGVVPGGAEAGGAVT